MGDVNYRFEAIPTLAPLVALVCVFLAVRAVLGNGPRWGWRFIPIRVVTAGYLAGVAGFTFFPFQIMYGKYADHVVWYNQINWYFLISLDPSAIPNVIMTVPLGILLPLVSGKVISSRRAAAFGAVFSVVIEVSQVLGCVLFNNYRGADVNDVLVNAFGCLLGYWMVRMAIRIPFLGDALRYLALPGSALAIRPKGVGVVAEGVGVKGVQSGQEGRL
ncbi:VanZ family protein [Streptomyces sp. NPDC052727]|uniref:VanZ family protein n=1 Tax=Streptomyces sp. NPDC052727 TaxID=3154854 RepID=UPI003416D704